MKELNRAASSKKVKVVRHASMMIPAERLIDAAFCYNHACMLVITGRAVHMTHSSPSHPPLRDPSPAMPNIHLKNICMAHTS
jgi:hypothetical protein